LFISRSLPCRESKENVQTYGADRSFCIAWSIFTFTDLYSDDECGIAEKKKYKPTLSDRMMKKVEKIYLKVLLKLLRVPKIVFGVVAILFITAVFILSKMGANLFLPLKKEILP
jgi:multidrug efflux pump subunit AcrB